MDLIVTHENADFDALSSLVAANKLYPGARLFLPGSQEKAVRRFLALAKDMVRLETEKTCRMDDVTRLIIVDNRHKSRIGTASSLLKRKKIEVHIYDHHSRTKSDIKADKDISKKVGATVTILLELLSKKGKLKLTPLEATLMLLGIYEETGFLSYSVTTRLDVDMVGKLLEQGANLNAVSSYLNRELSESELSLLIAFLESVEIVNVNGINIAFAVANAEHLDGEMGAVVHKLQDVENYPVLFAMFQSGEKIKILARSRIGIINVNRLLKPFNGGGHPSAAGARVQGKSSEQIKGEIIRSLERVIHPEVYARDIMSFPVKTVSQDENAADVLPKLKRFGYKGAPVLNDEGGLVGMITEGNLKKAVKHGMKHSRIKGYMATPLVSVRPDAPLYELRKILTEKDKRRIPVIEDNKLVGIVTRTDVLKRVHGGLFSGDAEEKLKMANVVQRIEKLLPLQMRTLIKSIGEEGDRLGINVFLVGGFARDLMLNRKNFDLDIVVEGDAIKFGKILADKLGGALVTHKKFGTAAVVTEWPKWLRSLRDHDRKFKLDVATARSEVYKKPAALPTVKFGSLREDLYRRDFTINAMAVSINKKTFGLFIDFFGGIEDLEDGIIRSLHDNSFIDDPTRIFRAVRFEQRFGFKIEKHTEYLIQHAISREMFKRTENQRIRDELILMLKEPDPEKAVLRMRELHELRFIHSKIVLKKSIKNTFREIKKCIRWYNDTVKNVSEINVWIVNFMVMLDSLTFEEVRDLTQKFVFTRSERERIFFYKRYSDLIIKKLAAFKKMRASRIYAIMENVPYEVMLCVMAKTRSLRVKRRIKNYLVKYSKVVLSVKGDDIKKEGVLPGPKYSEVLKKILFAKLDRRVTNSREEILYMRKLLTEKTKKF
ncbi:MAG: CBS domain-containing protein [Candidatus Omnitrophota bacterium]